MTPVPKHVTKMRDKSDYQISCQKPYLGMNCHAGLCHTLKNVTKIIANASFKMQKLFL